MTQLSLESIDAQVLRCSQCQSEHLIHDWLPISYFGRIAEANAWVVSINPSHREFLDGHEQLLEGKAKRFATLQDVGAVDRASITPGGIATALAMQDTVLERSPYRNFFNRIGRFLSTLHGANASDDPLTPFWSGVGGADGDRFLYAHLDIVKCATRPIWNNLPGPVKAEMVANCAPYLEGQILNSRKLRLLVVNGRTAFETVASALKQAMGFEYTSTTIDLGPHSAIVYSGALDVGGRTVEVVGWSLNVVNSPLKTATVDALGDAIRSLHATTFGVAG